MEAPPPAVQWNSIKIFTSRYCPPPINRSRSEFIRQPNRHWMHYICDQDVSKWQLGSPAMGIFFKPLVFASNAGLRYLKDRKVENEEMLKWSKTYLKTMKKDLEDICEAADDSQQINELTHQIEACRLGALNGHLCFMDVQENPQFAWAEKFKRGYLYFDGGDHMVFYDEKTMKPSCHSYDESDVVAGKCRIYEVPKGEKDGEEAATDAGGNNEGEEDGKDPIRAINKQREIISSVGHDARVLSEKEKGGK
jgi:hypothetical protein